ncbi:hypothetical protein PAXINDRAFT_16190 [Paxillus involutus ATCC 200175]|uniref:Uncharacterized protein n=1 Tax=Paxillus involutus ATCC 200175 TaxID=664439 RepID=A0A0C9TUB8_PAXIN|nr:hypothetical protein PAXINDRAFT_16190 [Paxillus involutus ATCC 200175]
MNRPVRSTANKNPAQIIIDNTQKRRTSEQKRADDATEAAKAKDLQKQAELEYQAKIAKITSMEDSLHKEDVNYTAQAKLNTYTAASTRASSKQPMATSVKKKKDDNRQMVESEIEMPDGGDDSETFVPEEDMDGNESKDKDNEDIEPEDEDIEGELSDGGNASKHQKGSYASNLSKDWKKKINQLQSTSTNGKKNLTEIHGELEDMSCVDDVPEDIIDLPPFSTATGHSRSSSYSSTTHYTGVSTREQSTVSGEFDRDETDDQVTAARKIRGPVGDRVGSGATKAKPHAQQAVNLELKGRERTTKLMGVVAESKDVDMAVEKTRSVGKARAQKHLKATDLPIGDTNHDHNQWEQLVRSMIDWAGTLNDPFGTNEHPELFSTIQELWDMLFEHKPLNVQDHPAIKKLRDNGFFR